MVSYPPPAGTNQFSNTSLVTRAAMRFWQNTNAFARNVSRHYEKEFGQYNKIGAVLNIRYPNNFVVGQGASIMETMNKVINLTVPLAVTTQSHVAIPILTSEQTLQLEEWAENYVMPQVEALIGNISENMLNGLLPCIANVVFNNKGGGQVGTPTMAEWNRARALLAINSAPLGALQAILNPVTQAATVTSLAGYFNPNMTIGAQTTEGKMTSRIFGISNWMEDQLVPMMTTGTYKSGATCTGTITGDTFAPIQQAQYQSAVATPISCEIGVTGLNGTLNKGDFITIAGVNAVNEITHRDTGVLRQFVVLEDVASGATSIPISPRIVPPNSDGSFAQFQNVTAAPANGAAITPVLPSGLSYYRNMVYSPDAFTLAVVPLSTDVGAADVSHEGKDGMHFRAIRWYDARYDEIITRLDVLYGFAALRRTWGTCVVDPVGAAQDTTTVVMPVLPESFQNSKKAVETTKKGE